MSSYFVIYNDEGDTGVEVLSKAELEKRLDEHWYGESPQFFYGTPEESDTNYWGGGILVIKGEIVTPRAKQVVTAWEAE